MRFDGDISPAGRYPFAAGRASFARSGCRRAANQRPWLCGDRAAAVAGRSAVRVRARAVGSAGAARAGAVSARVATTRK